MLESSKSWAPWHNGDTCVNVKDQVGLGLMVVATVFVCYHSECHSNDSFNRMFKCVY